MIVLEKWKTSAACRDMDVNDFYDNFDRKFSKAQREKLLKICYSCPVEKECFNFALETKAWGIHAGRLFIAGKPRNYSHQATEKLLSSFTENKI